MEIDYHYDYDDEYHDVFTSGLINIYPDFLMIIRMVLPLNGEDKIIQVNVAFFRVHHYLEFQYNIVFTQHSKKNISMIYFTQHISNLDISII